MKTRLFYQTFKGSYYANFSKKAFLPYLQNCGTIQRKVKILKLLRRKNTTYVVFKASQKAFEDKGLITALECDARIKKVLILALILQELMNALDSDA